MKRSASSAIFSSLTMLCLFALQTTALSNEQTTAKVTKPILTYTPPLRGAPATRVGGGTRNSNYELLTLTAIAPNHVGQTVSKTPTLYWYVSKAINLPVEMTISLEGAVEPVLETTLPAPIQRGIHPVRLEDHGVHLQRGLEYQWFVAVVRDPDQRSKDILAGGSVKRVDMPSELQAQLDAVDQGQRASVLSEAGIWYDAIARISSLIDAAPADRLLREQRASLLDQVGLVEAAAHDREPRSP